MDQTQNAYLKNNNLLTCKLDFCLPADNSPECVGCNALVHPPMSDDIWVTDQQVPLDETVARIRLCFHLSPVHLPPGIISQSKNSTFPMNRNNEPEADAGLRRGFPSRT